MSLTNLNPCRWLIDIGFVLKTPMHLGNGQDEESQKDDQEVWRAGIMLDYTGKPCIPGASLKGALRALADRQHILDDKLKRLFGHADGDKTIAGLAEFRYAFAQKEIKEESRPHVAIDRVTGTAQD
ncbi:MAG: RAMP superfamily CRISPR-associated protein, partial [Azonexus sp.]|nr:RAMP superfamily CRISPR-associated protein [Azonexus sp.]